MVRIPGFFEYDDDSLTPGKKKEGGLHQNLFDSEGKLKGNARFIPKDEPDPEVTHQPVNPHGKGRGRRPARVANEVAGFVAEIVKDAVAAAAKDLIVEATPHAKKLWEERGRPALEARRAEAARDAKLMWDAKAKPAIEAHLAKRAARKNLKATAKQPTVVEAEVVHVEERRGR